jgi:phosphoribosylamine--glycine ligase/phosphoribosylformylglycinamidine cyclo-ligase
MLPSHLAADIDVATWEAPAVFQWLRQSVVPAEMARTFNNGVGMVLAVSQEGVDSVVAGLEAEGETVYRIGCLTARNGEACVLRNLESWAV